MEVRGFRIGALRKARFDEKTNTCITSGYPELLANLFIKRFA